LLIKWTVWSSERSDGAEESWNDFTLPNGLTLLDGLILLADPMKSLKLRTKWWSWGTWNDLTPLCWLNVKFEAQNEVMELRNLEWPHPPWWSNIEFEAQNEVMELRNLEWPHPTLLNKWRVWSSERSDGAEKLGMASPFFLDQMNSVKLRTKWWSWETWNDLTLLCWTNEEFEAQNEVMELRNLEWPHPTFLIEWRGWSSERSDWAEELGMALLIKWTVWSSERSDGAEKLGMTSPFFVEQMKRLKLRTKWWSWGTCNGFVDQMNSVKLRTKWLRMTSPSFVDQMNSVKLRTKWWSWEMITSLKIAQGWSR